MQSTIVQKFIGDINGVKINDEKLFYSAEFLLDALESKFISNAEEINNPEFIKDFTKELGNTYFSLDDVSFSEIEDELEQNINNAKNFNNLEFKVFDIEWDEINQKIQAGDYTPSKNIDDPEPEMVM